MNKLISLAIGTALCVSALPITAQNTNSQSNPVVTWTRVKQPWYAPAFLIRSKMTDSIPEYKNLPGLLWKSYSIENEDNFFGGIYLWDSESSARAWFNPAWFERVKNKYGETQVPILKVLWMPENKSFLEKRMISKFILVHSFTWKEKEMNSKFWESMLESLNKEKDFATYLIAKEEGGMIRIFSFWKENKEPKETPLVLETLNAKLEGICSIPIHISK